MCLTVPGRIIAVNGELATVDYGAWGIRNASTIMVHADIGDNVLVQGGFVTKILKPSEAKRMLKAWEIVKQHMDESIAATF